MKEETIITSKELLKQNMNIKFDNVLT